MPTALSMYDRQRLRAGEAATKLEPLRQRCQGRMTFVLAPGPSLSQLWTGRATDHPKIAVKDAWRLAPDADALVCLDEKWLRFYAEELRAFGGMIIAQNQSSLDRAVALQTSGHGGFDPEPGYLRHGTSTGYAAAHFAAQLGGNPIVLVGFDHRKVDGKDHFFGKRPQEIRSGPTRYGEMAKFYVRLKQELDRRHIELLNATPDSAITCLPFVDLDQLLPEPQLLAAVNA